MSTVQLQAMDGSSMTQVPRHSLQHSFRGVNSTARLAPSSVDATISTDMMTGRNALTGLARIQMFNILRIQRARRKARAAAERQRALGHPSPEAE